MPGSQNVKTAGWIRTLTQDPSDPVRGALLKQPRELFHRNPSLSNQRPKSPFGQFFVVWNGEDYSAWRTLMLSRNTESGALRIQAVRSIRMTMRPSFWWAAARLNACRMGSSSRGTVESIGGRTPATAAPATAASSLPPPGPGPVST